MYLHWNWVENRKLYLTVFTDTLFSLSMHHKKTFCVVLEGGLKWMGSKPSCEQAAILLSLSRPLYRSIWIIKPLWSKVGAAWVRDCPQESRDRSLWWNAWMGGWPGISLVIRLVTVTHKGVSDRRPYYPPRFSLILQRQGSFYSHRGGGGKENASMFLLTQPPPINICGGSSGIHPKCDTFFY